MPKVKWAPTSTLYDSNMNVGLTNPLFTPVITLDQLEALIERQQDQCHNPCHCCCDDLLAQVQAWRTNTNS